MHIDLDGWPLDGNDLLCRLKGWWSRRVWLLGVFAMAALMPAAVAAQNGSIAPSPWSTFLDENGNPCSSCRLYLYAAGTTTPLDSYQNVGLTTPNEQPITLDAGGRATIFLSANAYKFRLTTPAGTDIRTADNITATHAAITGVTNTGDVTFQVDTDNNGTNLFKWLNGTAVEVAQLNESGNFQVDGTLQVDGSAIITGGARFPIVQTSTATGTQNDFALSTNLTLLRMNNATLTTFTGFAAGYDGQVVDIVSIGAGQVDLTQESGSSTAGNRILTGLALAGTNVSLAAGSGRARIAYDATTARWRVLIHEQGAWIIPAFVAGNFTGNGAMTWTLTSGDATNSPKYYLRGRTLTVAFTLATTTVGGTPNTTLRIGNGAWGGFTAALGPVLNPCAYVSDNGTVFNGAYATLSGGGATVIGIEKNTAANWTAATDASYFYGEIAFEVQ